MTERLTRWPAYFAVVILLCAAVFISYADRTNISVGAIAMQAQFGWSDTQKGFVLSAFFIGYLPLMIASGALVNRYGGRIILGIAVIWWSTFTALTPRAALLSLPALVIARVALGLGEAAVFPACFNMIAHWVPSASRSRAVALVTSSGALGTVIALPVSGWLVRDYGWGMPFYSFGLAGLVWAAFWFARLTNSDGADRLHSIAHGRIPWRQIMNSRAVWAIIVAHFCYNWCSYVLLAWLPSYFKSAFGLTIAGAGMISAAPWLVVFLMANVAGNVADYLMRAGYSATFVRKLVQTIGLGGAGIFLLRLPTATSITAALVIMCLATGSLATCQAGFAPNCLDVAPRHADIVYGISNTFATLPGLFGVFVTGWLVDRTGSFAVPFIVTACVALLGAIVFQLFGSGERQLA
jgi:ACS family sodium-dependent inorganic phosphate cotransporter